MNISVIICTHNPREDYLRRTLEALNAQTLPKADWELLLIDNASRTPLSKAWNLSWHPNARHVREDELGLTPARLRGIKESVADVIVFVDDDNLLDPHYLKNALEISRNSSHCGAWGGSCMPEFESQPLDFLNNYLNRLAISTVSRARWSNSYSDFDALPVGAGMVVRRSIAEKYRENTLSSKIRLALGRTGNSLASCEDIDLAWTAIDLGYSTGRFPELSLTHIIPPQRLKPEYILALIEGDARSRVVLDHARGLTTFSHGRHPTLLRLLWLRFRLPSFDYLALEAVYRGIRAGQETIRSLTV